MSEDELRTIEQHRDVRGIPALAAEVRRLRGLIKDAERAAKSTVRESDGHEEIYRDCPWCDREDSHLTGCPAFAPEGEVR